MGLDILNLERVRRAMRPIVESCVDGLTGEVNHTLLAETVAHDLGLDGGPEIPSEVFDVALEVGDEYVRERERREEARRRR